jgi:hypothetical protein
MAGPCAKLLDADSELGYLVCLPPLLFCSFRVAVRVFLRRGPVQHLSCHSDVVHAVLSEWGGRWMGGFTDPRKRRHQS